MILFILATLGLANIMVHGKILDDDHLGIRSDLKKILGPFGDGLDCYECCGLWAGLMFSWLLLPQLSFLWLPFHIPFTMITGSFAGSLLGHYSSIMTDLILSKTDFVVDDEA